MNWLSISVKLKPGSVKPVELSAERVTRFCKTDVARLTKAKEKLEEQRTQGSYVLQVPQVQAWI